MRPFMFAKSYSYARGAFVAQDFADNLQCVHLGFTFPV
jgi:hypothetical protein